MNLKLRRLQLKLTLEDVGNFVGVGKSTVRKWEQGSISNMGRDKIVKYASILRINPMELVDPAHKLSNKNIVSKIIKMINKLDNQHQERVYGYVMSQLEEQNSK